MQSEIQGAIMSENNTKCRPTSISHGYLMLSSFNCIPALATEVTSAASAESNRQKYVAFTRHWLQHAKVGSLYSSVFHCFEAFIIRNSILIRSFVAKWLCDETTRRLLFNWNPVQAYNVVTIVLLCKHNYYHFPCYRIKKAQLSK